MPGGITLFAIDPVTKKPVAVFAKDLGGGVFGLEVNSSVTINPGDIQIGAVENKDSNTAHRQSIKAEGVAIDADPLHNGAGLIGVLDEAGVFQRTVKGNSEGVMKVATFNRAAIKTAQKTVAAAATAEQFAAVAVPDGFLMVVKANKGNTGQAFIGGSKVDAENAAVRYPLEPDESVSLAVKNFDDVWLAVTTNGDGFTAVAEV